jgi:hypothetical protein
MGKLIQMKQQEAMLRMLQQPQEPRRRSGALIVVVVVLLLALVGVALFFVLRRGRNHAANVPSNPGTATLAKGVSATADQMTKNKMEGLSMIGYTSGDRINYVAAWVGSTGPGVVDGNIGLGMAGPPVSGSIAGIFNRKVKMSTTPVSFTWTPEAPPKGAVGPSETAPGATKSFVPGTLTMAHGSGLMATTLYLAPDTATGQVGWTEDKTYVGLYPTSTTSQDTFYLAFLSTDKVAATYGIPQNDSDPWILGSVPGNGFYVSFEPV